MQNYKNTNKNYKFSGFNMLIYTKNMLKPETYKHFFSAVKNNTKSQNVFI